MSIPTAVTRPARCDWQVTIGDASALRVAFTDDAGDPVDVSGGEWEVRLPTWTSLDAVELDSDVDDSDAEDGVVVVHLSAEKSAALTAVHRPWYLRRADTEWVVLAGTLQPAAPGSAGVTTAGTSTVAVTVNSQTIEVTVTAQPGQDGVGVPVGGTHAQALVKASDDDHDTEWATITAADIAADPATIAPLAAAGTVPGAGSFLVLAGDQALPPAATMDGQPVTIDAGAATLITVAEGEQIFGLGPPVTSVQLAAGDSIRFRAAALIPGWVAEQPTGPTFAAPASLAGTVSGLSSTVGTLGGTVAAHGTRLDTAEGDIDSAEDDIAELRRDAARAAAGVAAAFDRRAVFRLEGSGHSQCLITDATFPDITSSLDIIAWVRPTGMAAGNYGEVASLQVYETDVEANPASIDLFEAAVRRNPTTGRLERFFENISTGGTEEHATKPHVDCGDEDGVPAGMLWWVDCPNEQLTFATEVDSGGDFTRHGRSWRTEAQVVDPGFGAFATIAELNSQRTVDDDRVRVGPNFRGDLDAVEIWVDGTRWGNPKAAQYDAAKVVTADPFEVPTLPASDEPFVDDEGRTWVAEGWVYRPGGWAYAPAAPADWSPAPTTVAAALDQLAARLAEVE